MNFEELSKKLKSIEEGSVEECGMPMMPGSPKQSDSVTMNISMNGSGAGGIKDIIDILKNIEHGGSDMHGPRDDDDEVVVGSPKGIEVHTDEEFGNSLDGASDTEEFPLDVMFRKGNDLASKDAEALKVNGGGNPMQEALIRKLSEHYNSIKNGQLNELKYGEEDPQNPGFMWVKPDNVVSKMTDRDGNMVRTGSGGYMNAKMVPINKPAPAPEAPPAPAPEVNIEPNAQNQPIPAPAPEAPPAEVNTEPDAQNQPIPAPAQPCGPEVQAEIMKQNSFNKAYALAKKSGCQTFDWCQIVKVPGTGPKPKPTPQTVQMPDLNPMGDFTGYYNDIPVNEDESLIPGSAEIARMREIAGTEVVQEAGELPQIKAPTKQAAIAIAQKKGLKAFKYCGKYKVQDAKGGTGPKPRPNPPAPAATTTVDMPDLNPMGDFTGYYNQVQVPKR